MTPTIEITPARPLHALAETTDLLVRITPPASVTSARPPLDLALTLDTSGSMQGLPLDLAKGAALLIGQGLTPEDRLTLVTFNSGVQMHFPLQSVGSLPRFQRVLGRLQAGGSTALHAGWQLSSALLQGAQGPGRLPRVLLLTDGRANVGLCSPQGIAADVVQSLGRGVSTSTVGVGTRYDENLLEAIAGAGDGNYHFAETPEALAGIFSAELDHLRSTVGRLTSLEVSGVELLDVLNDLPVLPTGRLALPPLRAGKSLDVVLRVQAKAGDTLALRLAWTDAQGERHRQQAFLVFPAAEPNSLPTEHPEVVRVRAGLVAARAQREVARLMDAGDLGQALSTLTHSRQHLERGIRNGLNLDLELDTVREVEQRLQQGDTRAASKLARSRAYSKTTGRDEGGN